MGFSVQDSGPGLTAGLLEQFHKQLKPIAESTSVLSPEELQPTAIRPSLAHQIPADPLSDQSSASRRDHGEGVGLQIVKRLCELIGAGLEIESISGRGTLFRIRMPIHSAEKSEAVEP